MARHAFTLIEVLIVAVIIMVLIAISTPRFMGTFGDLELKDASYNLSKIIKYGQQRAIIEEKRYRLLFDFEKRNYYLLVEGEKDKEGKTSAPEEPDSVSGGVWKKATGRFGGYFDLPDGVIFKGESDKITFLPNGRCEKISIYLADQENKTIEIKTNGRAGYVDVLEVKQEE